MILECDVWNIMLETLFIENVNMILGNDLGMIGSLYIQIIIYHYIIYHPRSSSPTPPIGESPAGYQVPGLKSCGPDGGSARNDLRSAPSQGDENLMG